MQLPGDSIGISDLLDYRECPRRSSYKLRRHTGKGKQSDARIPEATNPAAIYGKAIHEAIALSEDGFDDEQAIQKAWNRHGRDLEPGDLELLRHDLLVYHERDYPNTRTLASEEDFSVPLFEHEGRKISFRFRVDRLYERLDAPGTFIHVDYKSSRWAKSAPEVHNDLQLWAYNFGIYEIWPECDRLIQVYDQLRYGTETTSKGPAQRKEIRAWLIAEITSVLEDDDFQDDGLLEHKLNRWCRWCPILESCPVVKDLTEFALLEIDTLAPTVKNGRKRVVQLDPAIPGAYLERFEQAKEATQILDRFQDAVKGLIRGMTSEQRASIGYELRPRTDNIFPPEALEALYARLGAEFFAVAKVSKAQLTSHLSERPELLEWALGLARSVSGTESVVKARS